MAKMLSFHTYHAQARVELNTICLVLPSCDNWKSQAVVLLCVQLLSKLFPNGPFYFKCFYLYMRSTDLGKVPSGMPGYKFCLFIPVYTVILKALLCVVSHFTLQVFWTLLSTTIIWCIFFSYLKLSWHLHLYFNNACGP